MAIVEDNRLKEYCVDVAARAKSASAKLTTISGEQKNRWLRASAEKLRANHDRIISANEADIAAAEEFELTDAQVDRLRLDAARIDAIADAMDEIAMLPNPIGEVMESSMRPNGLLVNKVRVPMGVVFFIYESRPNVTADAAAICLKSGNAVILRGGKEAAHSSQAIVEQLQSTVAEFGIPVDAVQLVNTRDRAAVGHFLSMSEYIDVAIPRGGEGLIRRVSAEATMPVIKHFDGNCHVYVDAAANIDMAEKIAVNSKCHRLGVCNAAESLLIHASIAETTLPRIASALAENGIEIRGDERTCQLFKGAIAAGNDDWSTEYLAPIISVKVVASLDEAIEHINRYGSGHTDTIVTDSVSASQEFAARVDSAAVMINASTRFNDGGEFGLGAEIGISTDRFHARGPCGLKELTSYKYIVQGNGQIR